MMISGSPIGFLFLHSRWPKPGDDLKVADVPGESGIKKMQENENRRIVFLKNA